MKSHQNSSIFQKKKIAPFLDDSFECPESHALIMRKLKNLLQNETKFKMVTNGIIILSFESHCMKLRRLNKIKFSIKKNCKKNCTSYFYFLLQADNWNNWISFTKRIVMDASIYASLNNMIPMSFMQVSSF